jgi:hypothetical protein
MGWTPRTEKKLEVTVRHEHVKLARAERA